MLTETNPTLTGAADCSDPHQSQQRESMSGSGYPKFKKDRGVPEICIGVREFMCIGESPPQDHPHVYINMGEADTILCPYYVVRAKRSLIYSTLPPGPFHKEDGELLIDNDGCCVGGFGRP
jgi:uncharacterized Zn-finger protein